MEKDKKKKTFGDLKIGDSIYLLSGLEVKELKITKVSCFKGGGSQSVTLYTDGKVNGYNYVYVGKHFSSSYSSTVFTEKKDAWERLIGDSRARCKELTDEIDKRIAEFDKLEKFLDNVKGKTLW